MAELKYLKKYSAETDICTLCGTCRTVCPIFLEEGIESSSTRGRISLINGLLTGDLTFTKYLSGKMYACLNCRKCIEVCPANVNYADLIIAAKADINLNQKKYFRVVLLKYLFNPGISVSNFSHRTLRFIRKILYKKNTQIRNFIGKLVFKMLRLPDSFILPSLPEKFFFSMNARHDLVGEQKKRVALFLGCGGKYNYPETSDHLIDILRKNGIEVLIPENQVCCGSPMLDNGNVKLARSNAMKNIRVFNNLKDISAVLVQCSNCSDMLKEQYRNFLDVGKLKHPVYDIMEYLRKEMIELTPRYSSKVSTHILLRNHSNINKDNFINDLTRSTYSENYMDNVDNCCGASELYNNENYNTRKNITNKFLDQYIQQDVKYIACTSFACIHKINEEASHLNSNVKAVGITDIFE